MENTQALEVAKTVQDTPSVVPALITKEERAKRLAILQKVSKMDTDGANQIASNYWSPTKGESIKGVFTHWDVLTPKDKPALPMIAVSCENGDIVAAQIALTTNMRVVPLGTIVQITCIDKTAGKAMKFEILELGHMDDLDMSEEAKTENK